MRVTAHALDRAKERLGLDKFTFEIWVEATRKDWWPVSFEYLLNHNVKAAAKGKGDYFITGLFHYAMGLRDQLGIGGERRGISHSCAI
jgi:hypothetical protein